MRWIASKLVQYFIKRKLIDECIVFGHQFSDYWIGGDTADTNEYGVYATCRICNKLVEVENVEEAITKQRLVEYKSWYTYLTRSSK